MNLTILSLIIQLCASNSSSLEITGKCQKQMIKCIEKKIEPSLLKNTTEEIQKDLLIDCIKEN